MGCSPTQSSDRTTDPVVVTSTQTTPAPVQTVVRSGPTYRIGTVGTLQTTQPGVGLTVRATGPSVSRTRLSSSYGYPPERGYYVTISVTLHNTGSVTLLVRPQQFYVQVPKQGKVTTTEGAAPYSGASQQLDQTELAGGDTLTGQLTFDVVSPHGVFVYAPSGPPALSWTY